MDIIFRQCYWSSDRLWIIVQIQFWNSPISRRWYTALDRLEHDNGTPRYHAHIAIRAPEPMQDTTRLPLERSNSEAQYNTHMVMPVMTLDNDEDKNSAAFPTSSLYRSYNRFIARDSCKSPNESFSWSNFVHTRPEEIFGNMHARAWRWWRNRPNIPLRL